jgi:hypothetical protein
VLTAGFFAAPEGIAGNQTELLQLDFLVFHMLACLGIKFHDQHFFRCGLLVLVGRVEVTGSSRRLQLDFFASAFSHGGSP